MNNFYRSDGWVKTSQGPAIPGAQIWVCLQPANVTAPITPPRTLPVPWVGPNPQALIYSDAGVTPITQPIITDGFGHYDFYALPGLYTVVVMFGGKVQQFYIDQSLGSVGSSSSSLLLSTNGTPNFNQTALNFVQGAGIVLATDNFGNITITGSSIAYPGNAAVFLNGTGVFSAPAFPPTMTSTVGGLVPTPPNVATQFLNGTGAFSAPPVPPVAPVPSTWYGWRFNGVLAATTPSNVAGIYSIGANIPAITSGATLSKTQATSTNPAMVTFPTSAAAQTQGGGVEETVIGVADTTGAGFTLPLLSSFVCKVNLPQTSTGTRCWIGLLTNVAVAVQANSQMAFDAPNVSYAAFRFSNGTDSGTNWRAVVGTSNVLQTVQDTGVAIDTSNAQTFKITYTAPNINFYINGVLTNQISANIPSTSTVMHPFCSVDNQFTTHTINMNWAYTYVYLL